MTTSTINKSVYRRGADDGFIFGLYLSVMFIAMALSITTSSLPANLIGLAMTAAVPVVIYFFLRRAYIADRCLSSFSAMWLHGICIFFFGSLIMALTAYVYMRLVNPSFIPETVAVARDTYESLGTSDGHDMAQLLEQVQRKNLYPAAGAVAVQKIWLAVFTGSLLSMILSTVIRLTTRDKTTPPPFR